MRFFIATILLTFLWSLSAAQAKPKVIILTDINLVGGDPDDRQSLIHLLWYSDELEILGIIPDRWNGKGYEACLLGVAAYRKDYEDYGFEKKAFPSPETILQRISQTESEALELLRKEAMASNEPVYILVWGSMVTLRKALFDYPEISTKIRVLSIGTGLKYGPRDEVPGQECDVPNWNGKGRNDIYEDSRFRELWWLENNWTYNGMFVGEGPKDMFEELSKFGALGKQIRDVTKGHEWAQYFRVGDTPSVTYLLDKSHDIDDPQTISWAGLFKKPFPNERPNYFTDDNDSITWDYEDPCNTWDNLTRMYEYNKSTLVMERQDMYEALLTKLEHIYR